ncbi:MAG: SRPBCC family protein [Bacteroidota bacterium]
MKSDQIVAASGQIRSDAPVTASAELVIPAPQEKIWELITEFQCWPMWMEDVNQLEIFGEIEPGTEFIWKANGLTITSQLQLVEPHTRLAWTGKALGTRAIHVWEFEALDEQSTLVRTRESMDGWFMKWFFSSKKLAQTLQQGLRELKLAACD